MDLNNYRTLLWEENYRREYRKTKEYQKVNENWNKDYWNHRNTIGTIVVEIKNSKAKTQKDFENYYFENVKTIQQFETLIKKYEKKYEVDTVTALNHIWIQTFDTYCDGIIGKGGEEDSLVILQNQANKKGYIVRKATDYQEKQGIDFVVVNKQNEIIGGLQQKSVSFALGKSKDLQIERTWEYPVLHRKFSKENNQAPVYFIFTEDVIKGKPIYWKSDAVCKTFPNPEIINYYKKEEK